MELSSLLKPSVWDEKILKQYTKLTRKWEDKGRSRYMLADIFNTTAMFSNLASFGSYPMKSFLQNKFNYGILNPSQLLDMYRTKKEKKFDNELSTDCAKVEPSKFLHYYKKAANLARMPFLLYGTGLVAKGAVGIGSSIVHSDSESFVNGLCDICLGYGFIGNASSIYVKDSDAKLLEKQNVAASKQASLENSLVPVPATADYKSTF